MSVNNSIAIVANIIKQAVAQNQNVMVYIKARGFNMGINGDTVDNIMNDMLVNDELVEFKDSNGVNLYFLRSKKLTPLQTHHTNQTSYDQELTPFVQVETDYLEYTVYETDQDTLVQLWQQDCWDFEYKMAF